MNSWISVSIILIEYQSNSSGTDATHHLSEGLFTPNVRILFPQKSLLFFSDFLDFSDFFPDFFGCMRIL